MSNTDGNATLSNVFEPRFLKRVWRTIGKHLREQLIRDPLDHLPYQTNLDTNLGALGHRIRSGHYRCRDLTRVDAAKRDGLTRPLAFLEIEDQIVVKAICDCLQPHLLEDFPAYVQFSRSHAAAAKDAGDPYESWFESWSRHQGLVDSLIRGDENRRFVVEADVASFFPSVKLNLLRNAVLSKSGAEEQVVNLLFYVLQSMFSRPSYCLDYDAGLPQENYDTSRVLAHFFLQPVDEEFKTEGSEGRYVRWVDDIKVAVSDETEGRRVLRRIQESLERRCLFLNSGKSRIVSRATFEQEALPQINAYLSCVHECTDRRETVDRAEFSRCLADFLDAQHLRGWDMVLRRFYTEARRVGSPDLECRVKEHLSRYPSSAQNIIAYVSGRPHTPELLGMLQDYLKSGDNLYPDVEIRIYSLLTTWRSTLGDGTPAAICEEALNHFFGRSGWPPLLHDYTRALISLICFKYGTHEDLRSVESYFRGSTERHFVRYAFCVLRATPDFKAEAERKALGSEDIELRRLAGFLSQVECRPEDWHKPIKNYAKSRSRALPHREELDPRCLPLLRISMRGEYRSGDWKTLVESLMKRLRKAPSLYRDEYTIDFLRDEMSRH